MAHDPSALVFSANLSFTIASFIYMHFVYFCSISVVYMSTIKQQKNVLRNLRSTVGIPLSLIEYTVLNSLIALNNENTYNIWKNSGLKHYPTVLRSLKKLEIKGLVKVLKERGERRERLYAPTLLGALVPTIVDQNRRKLIDAMSDKSTKFKELVDNKIDETFLYSWAIDTIRHLSTDSEKKAPKNLNKLLENEVYDDLSGWTIEVLNLRDNELELSKMLDTLRNLANAKWVKNLILFQLNSWLSNAKKDQKNLERFIQDLQNA